MKMINVIVNFRRYIKRRNYSPHTVKYYLNVIRQFVLWINVPLEQAGADKIEDYIDYLHQKRLQPASQSRWSVTARSARFARIRRILAASSPPSSGHGRGTRTISGKSFSGWESR